MTAREASLKVTLQPAAFQAGLRRMENMTTTAGKRMGEALRQPMVAGLKSAKKAVGDMVGGLKNGIKMIATLGGAVSFAGLAKDAVQMQNTYRNIAFNVNKVAGNAESWQTIQEMIQESVKKTGRGADDLSEAFMTVFEATGSMEFAKKSMEVIGTTATATGHSIGALATTMQLASRKFAIGPEEAEEAMTRMIEKTGVGGKGIEQLTNRFALVAGEAANAGMVGAAGISELLGVMLLLDSSIGEKADPGLKMMFQTVKKNSTQFLALKKAMGSGIKFTGDMTALDKIKATLSSARGRKGAEGIFTADARVVYDELAKPFDKAMVEAKERGMKRGDALNFALAAFDDNIKAASKSTMKFSSIQQEATKRVESDPLVKFQMAMARLKEAFIQPKMISAFDKLADKMPAFADMLGEIIHTIVDNPWESLAALVVGKIGLAFAGGLVSEAIANGMKALFARVMATQAATAAASIATGGATTLGLGGGIAAAGAAGGTGAAVAAGAGMAVGVLGAAAVGGAVGYGIYKVGMEGGQINEAASMRRAEESIVDAPAAARSGKTTKILDALANLAAARATMVENQSLTNTVFGSVAAMITDVESPTAMREAKSKEIAAEENRLREALQKLRISASTLGDVMDSTARSTGAAADAVRGPLSPPNSSPGESPKGVGG